MRLARLPADQYWSPEDDGCDKPAIVWWEYWPDEDALAWDAAGADPIGDILAVKRDMETRTTYGPATITYAGFTIPAGAVWFDEIDLDALISTARAMAREHSKGEPRDEEDIPGEGESAEGVRRVRPGRHGPDTGAKWRHHGRAVPARTAARVYHAVPKGPVARWVPKLPARHGRS